MAIAFDTQAGLATTGANTAKTFNITVASGTHRMMIIWATGCNASGVATNIAPTLVKYNGVSATLIGTVTVASGNMRIQTDAYYLTAPDVGTYAVTCTTGTSSQETLLNAVSLTGCKQQSPTYVTNTSATTTKALATSGLTYRSTDWLVDSMAVWRSGTTTFTPGSGQTNTFNRTSSRTLVGSTKPSGAGGTSWATNINMGAAALMTLDLEEYSPNVGTALLMALARR
jgi:hypothetical protein